MARRGDPPPVCASSREGPGTGARLCPEARSSERDRARTCKGLGTRPEQKSLQKSLKIAQSRIHWPLPSSQGATCQPRQRLHESTWYTHQRENVCHIPLLLPQNPINNPATVLQGPLFSSSSQSPVQGHPSQFTPP